MNKKNLRYWSDANSHLHREGKTHYLEKPSVGTEIGEHIIIGHLFILENLKSIIYIDMLVNTIELLIVHELEKLIPGKLALDY